MNESFMRKIYEAGPELDENMMQQGLNFYGQQFKNLIQTFPGTDAPIFLIQTFPGTDAPIFLAAMKAVHDSIRGVMPANGPELEDDILQHVTTVVIPIPGGKK